MIFITGINHRECDYQKVVPTPQSSPGLTLACSSGLPDEHLYSATPPPSLERVHSTRLVARRIKMQNYQEPETFNYILLPGHLLSEQ